MRLLFSSVLLVLSQTLWAQSSSDSLAVPIYDTTVVVTDSMVEAVAIDTTEPVIRRKPFAFVTNVPSDLWQMAKAPFKKQNLPGLIVTAAATALIIPFDQQILDGTRDLLDRVNLQQEAQYIDAIKIGNTKLLKLPKNITGGFYMIGEGSISMAIAGGLYLYGKIEKDQRAVHTAADLTETFLTMGISTQILKRISGRQSPSFATAKGGKWQPFPSFKEYQTNTTNYDAYPSGHLATMMATVTTLALNYPANKWIKPVGYSLIGLTGLAMVNTKVHWVGDYPLALALGYISAKITYLRNHPAPKKQIHL
jgi:membrane-associated phospholipid phosphatase